MVCLFCVDAYYTIFRGSNMCMHVGNQVTNNILIKLYSQLEWYPNCKQIDNSAFLQSLQHT